MKTTRKLVEKEIEEPKKQDSRQLLLLKGGGQSMTFCRHNG